LDAHDNAYAIFMVNKTEKWNWQILLIGCLCILQGNMWSQKRL